MQLVARSIFTILFVIMLLVLTIFKNEKIDFLDANWDS